MAARPCLCRCLSIRTSIRSGLIHHRQYSVSPSAAGFNNYEAEKNNFSLVAPEYYNFATDVIDKWAKTEADIKKTPAFWWFDDEKNTIKWSFSDLSEMSKRTANMLTGPCGLKRGDRVLVILPRVPEWWLLSLGCIRAGIVQIPGTTQLTTRDIKQRLQRSCAKGIIVDDTHIDGVDEIAKECPDLRTKLLVSPSSYTRKGWLGWKSAYNSVEPDFEPIWTKATDPMMIFFTSGTTGAPKMAEHSNASYGLGHTITAKYWLDLTPNDVFWNLSDTGWAKAAYSNIFSPWLMGSCVFIHHSLNKFDPEDGLKILAENPVDVFCAPPTGYRMMVQQKLSRYDGIQKVRHYVSAGEPLNPEVSEFWQDKTGGIIREGFGQTETVVTCASFRCIENRRGSMGKPVPGMPVLIIDDHGNEVPKDVEGNIALRIKPHRPLGLFTRYVDEPQRTEKTFKGEYYWTGDRAYQDGDGYYWFVSRDDDVITSAGYRIGPFEVESALIEHPAVAESAVVSSPDPIRGAIVKAFVVLTKDYVDKNRTDLKKELQFHVRKVTAPYKYPRKIEFVTELPKTVSGKIRRVELRHREWKAQQENDNVNNFTKNF